MAVTKIKPIRGTVNKAIAYILDPQKTDDAFYVSSYGCAASDAAAKEFEWTRNLAVQQGMQMPKVLARHLIQSFDIGEVTPEEAHEVGKQLADEWLKGKYARCKRFDRILKVAIYLTKNLAAGGRKPVYELFLDYDAQDFLTYSFMEKKWRTAMLRNLPQQGFGISDAQISSRDSAVIVQYLHSKWEAIASIWEFQEEIQEKQLLARHKKETDPWDAAMALVPPLPKDWGRWVSKVGVEQNYMFYQYRRGGTKTGYCSYCDREVPIRKPKHNAFTRCPRCRKTVQFKSFGKMGRVRTGRNVLYLMQPYPGGVVIREFWAERTYDKEKYRNIKAFYHEFRRAIFDADAKPVQAFYWGVYKQRTSRWIKGNNCGVGYYPDESGRVYGKTVPYLARTYLQKTGLPELTRTKMKIDPEKYLVVLKRMPNLEQLTKAGLFRLAVECTKDYYKLSSIFQTTPVQRGLAPKLGLNRLELARLRKNQGGRAFLEWLQFEKQTGKPIPDFAIQWMCKEHIDPQQLQFIADRMSYGQIQHYLNRQMQELNLSSERVIELWRDYLSMAFRFGYDTNDPIVYRVRKLLQRHDELAARGEEKQLTLRAGEILQTYPHVEQNLQAIQGKYAFSDEQFQLQVPGTIEDILIDSWKLCHCIANSDTYWERIERKESYLLFVRKASDLHTPYRAPRLTRQIFCYRDGVLLQSRLYPQNDDNVRKLYRSMVQSVIARCLGLPNLWKTNTTLTEIRPYWTTVQGSLHYTDYENGYAALSLMKGYGNYGHLEIGSASRCVGCGRPYDRHNSTHCGECEDMCVCKACGSVVPKNSGHFLDGDGFYCAECMQPCSCCGKLLPREALRPVLNRRGRTNQLCPSCEEAELANCRTCAAHSCCKDLRGLLFCERSRYTQVELEEQYA